MFTQEDILSSNSIDSFNNKIQNYHCDLCPLFNEAWALYNLDHPMCVDTQEKNSLLVIGDKPSLSEIDSGHFTDAQNSILRRTIEEKIKELKKDIQVAYLNACMCPSIEDESLRSESIYECNSFLLKQISLLKPAVILLAGHAPLQSLFVEHRNKKMKEILQTRLDLQVPGHVVSIPTFVTYHPRYLVRKMKDDQIPTKFLEEYDCISTRVINIAWRYKHFEKNCKKRSIES